MATMKVAVKGKNLDITPALRAYAEKKVLKLGKFISGDQELLAEVTLRVEREVHIAELTIDLKGLVLRGESRTNDMYASIDEAVDRVERQWNKFKTKIQKKLQGPKISEVVQTNNGFGNKAKEEKTFKVVKKKRFSLKPMDVEEAIMQMELLGHDFFVFTNVIDDEVNVVYKRREGNYGIIEPDF